MTRGFLVVYGRAIFVLRRLVGVQIKTPAQTTESRSLTNKAR
jgi:hypothetical protein